MPLLTVLLVIVVVGVLLWALNRYIPMQSAVQSILNGVVVIVLVVWLLEVFGLIDPLLNVRVGSTIAPPVDGMARPGSPLA